MIRQAIQASFLGKTIQDGECWLWNGAVPPHGYGQAWFNGKQWRAHRLSWALEHDAFPPDDLEVCHRCDRPRCVRPSHLFLGTRTENARDAASKGRLSAGDRHRATHRPRLGESNGASKLTDAAVREIRFLYAETVTTQSALARKYGVSQRAVWQVVNRIKWTHVE